MKCVGYLARKAQQQAGQQEPGEEEQHIGLTQITHGYGI
jgi:hypothetical protein